VLLWNRKAAEALEVVTTSLPTTCPGDASQEAGLLLSLGVRAAADLAQDGDRDRAAAALAGLDQLRASLSLDPFAELDTLRRAAADGRQWEAERSRVEGRADPDAWLVAARSWESLGMPHDAAYCWWRAAQALAATNAGKAALRDALHAAHRLANGHLPLREHVDTLAARERIPVLDAASRVDDDPVLNTGMTAQEIRVLGLLAGGLTNAEIGNALFISPKTASVHVSNLLRKLGVANRTEAAAWAIHHGLTT
jgi:DNA-binding CsgD family transcriptional regulator